MKNRTTQIIIFIFLLLNTFFQNNGFAQPYPGMSQGEFLVINYTDSADGINNGNGEKLLFKMYPVGAMFNGNYEYSPTAFKIINYNIPAVITDSFVVGYQKILDTNLINFQQKYYVRGAADHQTSNNECNFEFGMALYKIEFWSLNPSEGPDMLLNTLLVDWRTYLTGAYQFNTDLIIEFYTADSIMFYFDSGTSHNIDTLDKHIKHWQQFGTPNQDLTRQPNLGSFTLDTSKQEYLKFPINAKKYNNNIGHKNPGDLGMNLLINHNVTTRDTLRDTITNINITNKSVLTILANKTFDLITPVSPPTGRTNVTVEDSSGLSLLTNSKIIIRDRNKLTLKQNSFVKSFPGSELIIYPGGTFCNEGSEIVGPLTIRYLSGIFPVCAVTSAFEIKDSTSIVLSDSAVLELPDDFTLHISGKESSLILNPHSKIKFGENSKILVDSSATLIANGAEFCSMDSSKLWDGIVLSNEMI